MVLGGIMQLLETVLYRPFQDANNPKLTFKELLFSRRGQALKKRRRRWRLREETVVLMKRAKHP